MTKLGSRKLHICPKVTKMGSLIGHRIDYNGVGALSGKRHIPSKNLPKYPTPPPPGGIQLLDGDCSHCQQITQPSCEPHPQRREPAAIILTNCGGKGEELQTPVLTPSTLWSTSTWNPVACASVNAADRKGRLMLLVNYFI